MNNLDIQDEIVSKPPETISLLPSLHELPKALDIQVRLDSCVFFRQNGHITKSDRLGMDADAVIKPAMIGKISGSVSRTNLCCSTEKLLRDFVHVENLHYFFLIIISDRPDLIFSAQDNTGTLQETDMSLVRVLSDGLMSRLFLSFCALSDSSFSPDDLFQSIGEKG